MASNLAEKLESLSGYRHVYSPQDPNVRLNPVVLSHLRITVGGRRYHVLSRICAAGVDYTERSNKLAHHVAIDVHELPAAGPAWLLAPEREFMRLIWDGEPRVLAAPRRVPKGDLSADICQAWRRVTGDAGWGGWLAETAASGSGKQVFLIFRPGMDLLPLLAESFALLPLEMRWDVTFSTYHTKLPAGVDCQWRCIVEGSPEAVAVQRMPHNVVLDLCGPVGMAPASPYVEMARSGIWPLSTTEDVPSRFSSEQLPEREPGSPLDSRRETDPEPIATSGYVPSAGSAPDEYGAIPPVPPPRSLATYRPLRREFRRKRASGLRLAIVAAVVLILVAAGAGIFLWTSGYLEVASQELSGEAAVNSNQQDKEKKPDHPKLVPKKTVPEGAQQKPTKGRPDTDISEIFVALRGVTAGLATAFETTLVALKDKADRAEKDRQEQERKAAQTEKERKAQAERELKEKERKEQKKRDAEKARIEGVRTKLKQLPAEIDLPRLDEDTPQLLSALVSDPPKQPRSQSTFIFTRDYTKIPGLQLTLLVGAPKFGGESTFRLERSTGDKAQIWSCSFVRNPKIEVGQFAMHKEGCAFQWSEQLPRDSGKVKEANQLRNCILAVSASEVGEPRLICLRKPVDTDPKPLDLSKPEEFFDIGVEHLPTDIKVSWEFVGLPISPDPQTTNNHQARFLADKRQILVKWKSDGLKPGFTAEYRGKRSVSPFSDRVAKLNDEISALSASIESSKKQQKDAKQNDLEQKQKELTKLKEQLDAYRNLRLRVRVEAVVNDEDGTPHDILIVRTTDASAPSQTNGTKKVESKKKTKPQER
jgi:hypothetical protein